MTERMHRKIMNHLRRLKRSLAGLLLERSLRLAPDQLLWLERLRRPLGMQGERFKFLEDGMASIHACDFLKKDHFVGAYQGGVETGSWNGWDLRWRVRVILWAAASAARLRGDFVECGVNKGGFTQAVLNYLDFAALGKTYHLFDTFEGFDSGLLAPEEQKVAGHYCYTDCFAAVTARFGALPFMNIVRGSVPETLRQAVIQEVALLSIDMNCMEPEIAAADYFWPMLTPGGLIVLDDYGFSLHQAQKEAFNHWAAARDVEILELPTGQGLIIKPLTPSES